MGTTTHIADLQTRNVSGLGSGILIINADDWGRNRETTDRIHDCVRQRSVSSVSAMVFMEDSARAAAISREQGVDAGLHLNLTAAFTAQDVSGKLMQHHQQVAAYLRRRRVNQAIFHPGLKSSFEYVVAAQLEEYERLYGTAPTRLDGHHHMHLCANVLFGALMPSGTTVRRNFSFGRGDKGFINRRYRQVMDRALSRRHHLSDFFFALMPIEPPSRLLQILFLSLCSAVEVETHPVEQAEYRFLTGGEFRRLSRDLPLADHYARRPDVH